MNLIFPRLKKYVLLLLLSASICTAGFTQSTSIEAFVPASSQMVFSFDARVFFDLTQTDQFDNSPAIRKFFDVVNKKAENGESVNSLKDFGFNTESKIMDFYEVKDSTIFNTFIIEINDKAQFERVFIREKRRNKVQQTDGLNVIISSDKSLPVVTAWNEKVLVITMAFTGKKQEIRYFDFGTDQDSDEGDRDRMAAEALRYIKGIVAQKSPSISSNASYKKGKDDKAVGYFWVENYSKSIQGVMGIMSNKLRELRNMPNTVSFSNLEEVYSYLYFDENTIRWKSDMYITKKYAKRWKKVYQSKLNNNFFKYVHDKKDLGYVTSSFNNAALLEIYPEEVKTAYNGIVPTFKEEIDVAADLFSLLLDEKEIGKLITGDFMAVLHGMSEKEISYTGYEFDEDFQPIPVTKTKKEMSPDFTVMMGSENEKVIKKLMALGEKHRLMHSEGNYYKLKLPEKTPFELYLLMKEDVVLLTTSIDIIDNRFVASSVKSKKTAQKNNFVFYMNGENIVRSVPEKMIPKGKIFNYYMANPIGDIYVTSSTKKGKLTTTMTIETPEGHKNSLQYILTLINQI